MTKTPRKLTARQKFAFMHRLNGDKALSFSAKVVAVELLTTFHNTKTGRCNPGFAGLAESAGCSQRTAFSAISELKNAGWIAVESTHGGSSKCTNRYSFDFKRVQSASPLTVAEFAPLTDAESAPVQDLSKRLQTSANEPLRTTAPPARGVGVEISSQRAPGGALEEFEELRQLWQRPYGTNEAKALAAFNRIIGDGDVLPAGILESAGRWVAATEPDRLQPLERWLDDGAWRNNPPARRNSSNRKRSAAEVAAGLAMAASREEGGGW